MHHETIGRLALPFLLSVASAALADETENVVSGSVVSGWTQQSGQIIAAIKLDLEPGWKTYWRAPGDAGIPPQISWRGSRNLAKAEAQWPTPVVFDQNGMTSIGYQQDVLIPLVLQPKNGNRDITLKAKMNIGVCKEICIPATLNLNAKIERSSRAIVPEIAAALVDRPYSAQEAKLSSAKCNISATEHGLQVEAELTLPHTGGREFGVVETDNPEIWVSEAEALRTGAVLRLTSEFIHIEEKPFLLQREGLRFTILGSKYAVDVQGCEAG